MTLVASALAGGRLHRRRRRCCAVVVRPRSWGVWSKPPSTLGTFLRSFRWGHVRQLDRVSRELLARAWATGDGTRRRAPDHRY